MEAVNFSTAAQIMVVVVIIGPNIILKYAFIKGKLKSERQGKLKLRELQHPLLVLQVKQGHTIKIMIVPNV